VAETGSEYLRRLRQEAEHSPLLLLLESTIVFAIAIFAFLMFYVGQDGHPLFSHIGYYGVAWIGLGWLVVSTTVYVLSYQSYLRHYLAVLADRNLLVDLLEAGGTGEPGSFKQRTRAFERSYHSRPGGRPPYPAFWRWASLAAFTAAIFYFMLFAGTLALWFFGFSRQYDPDINRLALYLFSLIVSMHVWMVLDRPRHVALRAALALALLRSSEDQP
jgi:hypothetical protein